MNRAAPRQLPILMYHSVCRQPGTPAFARFVVTPDSLERHLAALGEAGYRAVALSELISAAPEERCVALTFDDGFADFHDNVLPVLQVYGARASLFVATGYLGGGAGWLQPEGEDGRPMLDWPQLVAIDRSGLVELGAHSHAHPPLDEVDAARRGAEIRMPRRILEDRLQVPVRTFAYPFGYHDRRVRRAVAAAGYELACEVGDRAASSDDDPLALPRWTVPAGLSAEALLELVAARRTSGAAAASVAKRVVWRERRRWRPGFVASPVPPPRIGRVRSWAP
jgi:peptidoglycan/xylan/chitin deacetylase (PgdA/CDA1 family)